MRKLFYILLAAVGLLLIGALLPGCRVKKVEKTESIQKKDSTSVTSVNKNTLRHDSIVYRDRVVIETKIVSPCDSNGQLKPFKQRLKNGQSTAEIETVKNPETGVLELLFKSECEALKSQYTYLREYQDSSSVASSKEIDYWRGEYEKVVNKTSYWLAFVWSIILNVLFIIIIIKLIIK